ELTFSAESSPFVRPSWNVGVWLRPISCASWSALLASAATRAESRSRSKRETSSPGISPARLRTVLSLSQPEFSAPWLAYSSAARFQKRFWSPAESVDRTPTAESGPMKVIGLKTMRSLPALTYLRARVGIVLTSKYWQAGHWRSPNTTSVTGAVGRPSARACWGGAARDARGARPHRAFAPRPLGTLAPGQD